MNRAIAVSRRRTLALALVAATAAVVWVTSQITAQTQIFGLWRDAHGGLWCGGPCGAGQTCCVITPVKPETQG